MAKEFPNIRRLSNWPVAQKLRMVGAFVNEYGQPREPLQTEEKHVFWVQTIREFCEINSTALFGIESFNDFIRGKIGCEAHCIRSVINIGLRGKVFYTLNELMKLLEGKSDAEHSWTITGLLRSVFHIEDRASAAESLETPKYVHVALLQTFADDMLRALLTKNTQEILCLVDVKKEMNNIKDCDTLIAALLLLQVQKKCLLQKSDSGMQFVTVIRESSSFQPPTVIDLKIAELEFLIKQVSEEIEEIMKSIQNLEKKAAKMRAKCSMNEYLNCVRMRQHAELELARKTSELNDFMRRVNNLKQEKLESSLASKRRK